MKKDDELKRYFRKRIKTVIRECSTPSSERTPETFHRLRVEIKKILSFYSLIEFSNKAFKRKKYFEPFKSLFKSAGKVRKLQLEQRLMNTYKIAQHNRNLYSILMGKQKQATRDFERNNHNKAIKEIDRVGKKAEDYIKDISEKDILKYNQTAVAEIHYLVQKKFSKEDVHETRKQIKEFLYNLKFTADKVGEEISSSQKLIAAIDHLQELIGKWHDYETTLIHLTEMRSKKGGEAANMSPSEALHLNKMTRDLSLKDGDLLRKIDVSRKKLKRLLQTI